MAFSHHQEEMGRGKGGQRFAFTHPTWLAHYYQKDFEYAQACFQRMLTLFKEDVVARIYLERCERYQQGVPEDWDGVEVLKSK